MSHIVLLLFSHHKTNPTDSHHLSQILSVCPILFHTESLIGLVGPHLRLFLTLNMMPLKRSVLKEIVFIALLQTESWNKYLMMRVAGQYPNSGRRYLLPLDGAAYLKY